jgi:transaldolase
MPKSMSERLQTLGAKPQRPLWASTGIKNPAYSDVLYVEQLIAPGVINTMPEGRTLPASTSTRSRPNSSARAWTRSAIPTAAS